MPEYFNKTIYEPSKSTSFSASVEYPDHCPFCERGQTRPTNLDVFITVYKSQAYGLYQCQHSSCDQPYLVRYQIVKMNPKSRLSLVDFFTPSFVSNSEIIIPETITGISPDFARIFTQASTALQTGLDEIAGPGLRKALEYLVKDWLISKISDVESVTWIKAQPLGKVINEKIPDGRLQEAAKACNAIGTDEGHYERRYSGADITQLQKIIEMFMRYLEYELTLDDVIGVTTQHETEKKPKPLVKK